MGNEKSGEDMIFVILWSVCVEWVFLYLDRFQSWLCSQGYKTKAKGIPLSSKDNVGGVIVATFRI